MTKENALAELGNRRERFTAFRTQVDEDLRRLRVERLASEQSAIRQLVLEAYASGATVGEIKRAYGTKDHRTITDIINGGTAEIEQIRKELAAVEAGIPGMLWVEGANSFSYEHEGHTAVFEWYTTEDGEMVFTTDTPLWDSNYEIKNAAVEVLSGKTENESDLAAKIARAVRERD